MGRFWMNIYFGGNPFNPLICTLICIHLPNTIQERDKRRLQVLGLKPRLAGVCMDTLEPFIGIRNRCGEAGVCNNVV